MVGVLLQLAARGVDSGSGRQSGNHRHQPRPRGLCVFKIAKCRQFNIHVDSIAVPRTFEYCVRCENACGE